MGSTLEHGIYLPSEGEKNCYQGLAGNWNKVDGALGDIAELKQSIESKFTKEIVTELPTEDINPFCIYMILKTDPETDNIYDEWVYINNSWEYLGNTKVDMTQYYTKQEVNQLPAVASGVTATKVGNYDAHIANGDIHVTASDKTKWTNSANTHVLRLALSALTPSTSDNSFSNLDDATALKVGDKVMDTAGVLFEVTAIDTQNSTFTIGTALVDLAQDSDVVHKSGNETINGIKTFSNDIRISKASPFCNIFSSGYIKGQAPASNIYSGVRFFDDINSGSTNTITGGFEVEYNRDGYNKSYIASRNYAGENHKFFTVGLRVPNDDIRSTDFLPSVNGIVNLGTSTNKWQSVYSTNYYYGNDNVEFSTKFVTTDTDQTISGVKSFTDNISTKKIISNVAQLQINARSDADSVAVIAGASASDGGGVWVYGKNTSNKSMVTLQVYDTDASAYHAVRLNMDGSLTPTVSNNGLGSSSFKWRSFNGLNPSSLGMPDLSNGIDISSYITNFGTGTVNEYTPVADGWISIANSGDSPVFIRVYNDYGFEQIAYSERNEVGGTTGGTYSRYGSIMIPCIKNIKIYIIVSPSTSVLVSAKFYPCQGNV